MSASKTQEPPSSLGLETDAPRVAKRDAQRSRPKLAASLLLVRQRVTGPELLMGRRASAHAFMPQKFVYPGGRVDRADAYGPADGPIDAADRARLETALSPGRARAAPLAALRETAEETGLLVAREAPCDRHSRNPEWSPFLDRGLAPAVSRLRLLARAITPPGRTRRFDAFFFLARAEELDLAETRPATAELEDVGWFSFDAARALDLPLVTRFVLEQAALRLKDPSNAPPPPFLRVLRGRERIEPL